MISVIVPVYNVANYLDQCIGSIFSQTYQDWECILVDDGSTDSSGYICDNWAGKDHRIKVVHQHNAGVSEARNNGIETCLGEYICFVDSDDWVSPDYLNDLWKTLKTGTFDLVVSGISQVKNNEIKIYIPPQNHLIVGNEHTLQFVELNRKNLLYGPTAILYRKDIIKKYHIRFPKEYSYGEDLIFNYTYLDYVQHIGCVPISNYYYRIIGTETLSKKYRDDRFATDYTQWNILKSFYEKHDMWNDISKKYLYQKLWGIIYDGVFEKKNPSISYIKNILSIPEIKDLEQWQEIFHSAKWIKWGIINQVSLLFYIYLKIHNK